MNKTLMTALCALGVAGFALTTEAAPRPAGRGHRDSATKIFQKTAAHDLGHVVGSAAQMGVSLVGAAVAQAAGLGTTTVVTPGAAPAVVVTPTPAPAVVVTPPPPPVIVTPPARTLHARPLTRRPPPGWCR